MKIRINVLFYFFIIFGITAANAQIQGTINYQCTIDDKAMSPDKLNYIVYFNNSRSIEFGVNALVKSGQVDESTEIIVIDGPVAFLLKDFKSKKIVLADYLGDKPALVNDTLSSFNWTITKEKKKILNFNCTKALTTFRGRNYIAWFTDDIPVQNGPWKFCGLPGLIVKINDDKQVFMYELTGINLKAKFNNNIIMVPKDYVKYKPITQQKFIAMYNKSVADNAKMSRVVHPGKDGSFSTTTVLLKEQQEKF